jgi:hypothetical protein
MIHIVFNASETLLMEEVIKLDESLTGEVIQVKDDFAVGPLADLDTAEGWQQRTDWWMDKLKGSPYENNHQEIDDRNTVQSIIEKLRADEAEQVWIWMGQNQHDVTGYYWLMPQLKEFQGRVIVIYLNNLPFINEKGQLFYPSWIHEIQPRELLKAKKLSRAITLSEFEVDPDEWKRLVTENSMVRILEGGKKIVSMDESFYDGEILKNLTSEWQKASRVLSNTLNRMKIKTGDVFLMWRMKSMIESGKISVVGEPTKGWKDFDVRIGGSNAVTEGADAEQQQG